MKTFCNEFCKATYFMFIGVILASCFYIPKFSSLGVGTTSVSQADPTPLLFHMSELPSLIDIQRKLNELEPNNPLKVDGRWGKLTCEKWDRVYCNEQAKKYFEGNKNEN